MNKILIIDDDKNIKKMLVRRLKKAGYDISTAENGAKGVEAVYEVFPDIIFMDMDMPVMDGYQATRTLRNKGWEGLIIALTASVMSSETGQAMEAGCDHFFPKPIGTDFETKLKTVLEAGHETDSDS